MRILIFGGAASGKSEYAEQTAVRLAGAGERIYLATMQPCDGESRRRVERHRLMRSGKGFRTVELPLTLAHFSPAPGAAVLLEDLGNLLANRLFAPEADREGLFEVLNAELERLEGSVEHLVVVSSDIHRDGVPYPGDTAVYQGILSRLHGAMALRYDQVTEVVCGLPVFWKGGAG